MHIFYRLFSLSKTLLLFTFASLLFIGCSQQQQTESKDLDCNAVYKKCYGECLAEKEPRAKCDTKCKASKAFCNTMKYKVCVGDCTKKYGKTSLDFCKKDCNNKR